MPIQSLIVLCCALPLLAGLGPPGSALAAVPTVAPLARTETMLGTGDVADDVSSTDGIDATCADLGGRLAQGMFIAHDGEGHSPSNYKVVPWEPIASIIAGGRRPQVKGTAKAARAPFHPLEPRASNPQIPDL